MIEIPFKCPKCNSPGSMKQCLKSACHGNSMGRGLYEVSMVKGSFFNSTNVPVSSILELSWYWINEVGHLKTHEFTKKAMRNKNGTHHLDDNGEKFPLDLVPTQCPIFPLSTHC